MQSMITETSRKK